MELKTRNINTSFRYMVELFDHGVGSHELNGDATIVRNETRNGPVLRIDEPVLITYERPLERVLFNEARDANPFFHVYEALWMLTGRNDVGPLAYYASNMANYSDDGETLNGAYGYRWRHANQVNSETCDNGLTNNVDQLEVIVQHLKADPTSRRAVLQMWNVEDDLLKINADESGLGVPYSKDVCCNTAVYFSMREIINGADDQYDRDRGARPPHYVLDMTVTNRSNDMIWGMLGANYVHFTFLQEYMAARLGVEVGRYHHFTNNLHVYENNWKPEEWLAYHEKHSDFYVGPTFPLVADPERFEQELPKFVEHHSGKIGAADLEGTWTEPFLAMVAGPMLCAFTCHKEGDYHGALILCDQIEAADWKQAATAWIRRRMNRKGVK